jgi:hypothetical protein
MATKKTRTQIRLTPSPNRAWPLLSSVLHSDRAIDVNVAIMRTFVRLREILGTHKDLARQLAALERKYDSQFKVVFDAMRRLVEPPPTSQNVRLDFTIAKERQIGATFDGHVLSFNSRPCMFNFNPIHTDHHSRQNGVSVASRGAVNFKAAATTAWVRFSPPTFGVRNWYILRHDRLSQGLPISKGYRRSLVAAIFRWARFVT